MRKLGLLSLVAMSLLLTGCGNGSYRYPCQDPANWETADCKPPVCTVNGTCPEDLVGEDVVNGTTSDGGTITND